MGTWAAGLLDNDTALDGLGDFEDEVLEEALRLATKRPSAASLEQLAAAVGLLTQLWSDDFLWEADREQAQSLRAAIAPHLASKQASAPARALLKATSATTFVPRPTSVARPIGRLLHQKGTTRFGRRPAGVYETAGGAALIARLSRAAERRVAEDFSDEDTWADLCREGLSVGLLALPFATPLSFAPKKLERWRRLARKGLETIEGNGEEVAFHRRYYRNLDALFERLLAR